MNCKYKNSPILNSLLDTDAYKFYMQQAVFHKYHSVVVRARFLCRNNDFLGKYASVISEQIEMMKYLRLSKKEYKYLKRFPFFCLDYLNWLQEFRFNPSQVKIRNLRNRLDIQIKGPWKEVILWEVPLLAIISEIVHYHRFPNVLSNFAIKKLHQNIEYFYDISKTIDISKFRLIDFGTRRRFSRKVQFEIVYELQKLFPYFIGTSNYQIAHEMNLTPWGTQAHEWFQAHQQISPNLANSQKFALQAWLDEYPNQLGIALTDCITTDAFFKDFGLRFAHAYQGLRHDSGDPIKWGEKAISHYIRLGINPLTKILIFSDSLDFKKSLKLYQRFWKRVNLAFGIGTKLTCNIPKIKPLNIVIKLVECNGKPVAKLSDSPGKTICQNKSFIRSLKEAFSITKNIKEKFN